MGLIRNAGVEPHVIEYLKTPPTRTMLASLIQRAGLSVRQAVRHKGTPYHELGLDDSAIAEGDLLDAMLTRPILINRPFVVSPLGVRLCRPSEIVLEILPETYLGSFAKEDGEPVIDASRRRVAKPMTPT